MRDFYEIEYKYIENEHRAMEITLQMLNMRTIIHLIHLNFVSNRFVSVPLMICNFVSFFFLILFLFAFALLLFSRWELNYATCSLLLVVRLA